MRVTDEQYSISDRDRKVLELLEILPADEDLKLLESISDPYELRRGDWYKGIKIKESKMIVYYRFQSKDTFTIYYLEFIHNLGESITAYPITLATQIEVLEEYDEFTGEDYYELAYSFEKTITEDTLGEDVDDTEWFKQTILKHLWDAEV